MLENKNFDFKGSLQKEQKKKNNNLINLQSKNEFIDNWNIIQFFYLWMTQSLVERY